jgi:hypothetical protein
MFIAVMAALGNVLSFISIQLSPIIPSIPLGPISVSLAVDISHLTTFIASLFGGSIVGGLTGAIGGLVAAFEFGFSRGNYITGFGLPIGKALTGITAGYIMRKWSPSKGTIYMVISTVIAYIPEALLTLFLFVTLLPSLMGLPSAIAFTIAIQIIVKAFFEMVALGILLSMLTKNKFFTSVMSNYFT